MTIRWKPRIRVPDDVYDADVAHQPATVSDRTVDSAIRALAAQVAGSAEGEISQGREDPDQPR